MRCNLSEARAHIIYQPTPSAAFSFQPQARGCSDTGISPGLNSQAATKGSK